VHGAAAGHGEIDLQIAQAVCVELEGVIGERDRIGMFARRDRAEALLVEAHVGAARGKRAERFLDADALFGSTMRPWTASVRVTAAHIVFTSS